MKLLTILAVIIFCALMLWAANYGLKLHEANECARWQREAEIYPNYYLENWQRAQCQAIDINLD